MVGCGLNPSTLKLLFIKLALERSMNFHIARVNMVEQQVRPWHVLNDEVLQAMSIIPREQFVPEQYVNLAYSDTEIPIGQGQTMLSPKIVGRALQSLKLRPHDKVLEIGTGTGYVTACLSKLVHSVISIELDASLLKQAEKQLSQLHCRNITLEQGDGVLGWESYAPYDAIIITGSYPLGIPKTVCEQVKPNTGRVFGFSGLAPAMEALLIDRTSKTDYHTHSLFETVVPALVNAPKPTAFHF